MALPIASAAVQRSLGQTRLSVSALRPRTSGSALQQVGHPCTVTTMRICLRCCEAPRFSPFILLLKRISCATVRALTGKWGETHGKAHGFLLPLHRSAIRCLAMGSASRAYQRVDSLTSTRHTADSLDTYRPHTAGLVTTQSTLSTICESTPAPRHRGPRGRDAVPASRVRIQSVEYADHEGKLAHTR